MILNYTFTIKGGKNNIKILGGKRTTKKKKKNAERQERVGGNLKFVVYRMVSLSFCCLLPNYCECAVSILERNRNTQEQRIEDHNTSICQELLGKKKSCKRKHYDNNNPQKPVLEMPVQRSELWWF